MLTTYQNYLDYSARHLLCHNQFLLLVLTALKANLNIFRRKVARHHDVPHHGLNGVCLHRSGF